MRTALVGLAGVVLGYFAGVNVVAVARREGVIR